MNLQDKLQRITLFVTDVDGTLTDSAMFYTAQGEFMKRFSTRDGMGITLLRRAGIIPVIMTSEHTPIVSERAKKLQIEHCLMGVRNKKESLLQLVQQIGCSLEQTAFIGDDINDENPIRMSGVGACPADAVEIIRNVADYICAANGGHGAVREFAELILKAQGKPISLPESF